MTVFSPEVCVQVSVRLRPVGTAQCTRLLAAEQLEGFVRHS